MNDDAGAGTVIVVADDAMQAARAEAGLHALEGWRRAVCRPARLPGHIEAHPAAIVVTALADVETRRMLRALRDWRRRPAIVALADDPASLWTPAARAVGLRAALPRTATGEELTGAVRAVHAGLFALHAAALSTARARGIATAPGAPLTSREHAILEMVADGFSNRAIAARLGISRHTVKFHVASILGKLGAGTRTEAVALALRRGLLAV
jgi:DNA-binding NarL/FixJ family response regulator